MCVANVNRLDAIAATYVQQPLSRDITQVRQTKLRKVGLPLQQILVIAFVKREM
jgi:hypothetical protein